MNHVTQRKSFLIVLGLLFFINSCTPTSTIYPPNPPRTDIPRDTRMIGERFIGVFMPEAAWRADTEVVRLEEKLGYEFRIIHWFTSWRLPFEKEPIEKAFALGRAPLISWQANQPTLEEILAGKHDAYIREWAQGTRDLKGEIYLRIFPEMNGDWANWHGDSVKLKQAWVYIVNIFRSEGATNVKWVWCPNITDEPRTQENRMENYYPGDAYVDILGVDGYNWGNTRSWSTWTSFENLFVDVYYRLSAIADNKAIWIVETASAERGGDKASWISDMLKSDAFPRVEAVIWFNEDKEADWRIESSEASAITFRSYFQDLQVAQK